MCFVCSARDNKKHICVPSTICCWKFHCNRVSEQSFKNSFKMMGKIKQKCVIHMGKFQREKQADQVNGHKKGGKDMSLFKKVT